LALLGTGRGGMRVLVAGKGGAGKTTITALLSHIFSNEGFNVLALDTDSIPNLALTLGVPREKARTITPLIRNGDLIEERTGARPGGGWGLLFSLTPNVEDVVDRYALRVKDNLKLLVIGGIDGSGEGCLCPAVAFARALVRRLLLGRRDVVIVDSEAGAEVFGRGLAEKFDYMLCVCEPTLKSLDLGVKLCNMAVELGVGNVIVVINKVVDYDAAYRLYEEVSPKYPCHIVRYDENVLKMDVEGRGVDMLPADSPALLDVRSLFEEFFSGGRK